MRRLCLVILAALLPEATHALEGRIVDAQTGAPLAHVTVSVVGRAQTTRSDAEGKFVLVPDPQPPFELLAILPGEGYVKPVRIEALPAEGPLVVRLEPSVTESLAVTAGAAPGIRTAPAAGTTVVSREDMGSRDPRTLTEALENVPGIASVSEGNAAVPAIRGLAQARSLLLIDGARVTAERRVGPSATFLDPFIVEGVEVARGPGSVSYGSDAFGGVILARTRRPRPGAEPSFGVMGAVGTGVPQERIGLEVQTGLGEHAGLLVSGHHRDFEDYESPEGDVLNSAAQDTGFLVAYAQLTAKGLLSLGVQGDYGRDIGRPRTDSDVVRFYYPTEDSLRFTAAYETGPVLGFDETELSLFLGDYDIVTDQDTLATGTTPRQILRADVRAKDYGMRAEAARHWGQTSIEFGLDLNGRFDLEAEDVTIDFDLGGVQIGETAFTTIEDAQRLDSGVYVSADHPLGSEVSLGAGLRYDHVRSTNRGGYFGDTSVTNAEPSGFLGLTFGPFRGFSTTVQYSHGFRDARLSDRFFRGVTGAGFITGNPDLEPETSDQYDLVFRWGKGRWHPALYAYHYEIEDLIERYEDPSQPDFFFFRNRGTAEIRGMEAELLAELPARVQLLVSGSVSQGTALDDDTPLDDIAPENAVVQVRKELGKRFWVQLRGAWLDDLDEPGPNEVSREGHTLVDASAGWRVAEGVELQLLVRNALDETYLLTPDRRSPLAPGRSAVLSARGTF